MRQSWLRQLDVRTSWFLTQEDVGFRRYPPRRSRGATVEGTIPVPFNIIRFVPENNFPCTIESASLTIPPQRRTLQHIHIGARQPLRRDIKGTYSRRLCPAEIIQSLSRTHLVPVDYSRHLSLEKRSLVLNTDPVNEIPLQSIFTFWKGKKKYRRVTI